MLTFESGALCVVQHKNAESYHGGDYDKEQPEEEDDEAEQIDYEADRSVKEGGKVKLVKNQKMLARKTEKDPRQNV
uniref:Uncharacterized protein n=1 Tax=Rhodnius prolixus TaxID=13249 RepID=T1HHI0_RHOPR